MKYSELRALSDEQLVHKELSLERSLLTFQLRHRLGRLEDTSVLQKARRDIARVQTLLTEREHASMAAKGSLRAKYAGTFVAEAATEAADQGGGFLKGLLDSAAPTE